jgi:alkylation response protein AidB-like acyl-CoA dehydrogenase
MTIGWPENRVKRRLKGSVQSGTTLQAVAGFPLRVLTRLSGSEAMARLGLRAPAERLVFESVRAGTRAIGASRGTRPDPHGRGAKPLAPWKSSGLFDLTPTDEQGMMRDSMRRFAESVLRPAAGKADAAACPPDDILAQGHALYLAGLAIPETLGGAATERSSVSSALIAEELARGDMGLATAILAPLAVVQALVEWGTPSQQAQYLPRFLEARFAPAALAVLESGPQFDPLLLRTRASPVERGGWRLWGEKSLVPLAAQGELYVVAAAVPGGGAGLLLVERNTPGLSTHPDPAMGVRGAGLGKLVLQDARVPAGALLGGSIGNNGLAALGAVVDRARIAWAAMAVGTAQAVLDYVIPYCNDRRAFGEAISNRQAVAFSIADIAIELEGMRLLVQRAASRVDHDAPEVSRSAALARLQCADKGAKIGSDGVQLLGGHGYIKDHPVERFYRDLRAIGVMEGGVLA